MAKRIAILSVESAVSRCRGLDFGWGGMQSNFCNGMRNEALKVFVRVQFAKRLAALGGTMHDMPYVPWFPKEPAAK